MVCFEDLSDDILYLCLDYVSKSPMHVIGR